MKKLIIVLIPVITVFAFFFVPEKVIAENGFDISVPEKIDITDEETSFTVTFNSAIENNQCIRLSYTKELTVSDENGNEYLLKISSSKDCFSKEKDEIIITVTHEPFADGSYRCDLDLNFTLTPVQVKQNVIEKTDETADSDTDSSETEDDISYERKTMYITQDVLEWDMENYSETPPSTINKEMIQYAFETAEFSDEVYSDTIPEDGFYLEKTMYGCKERTKKAVQTPYSYEARRGYNNIGACPADCISGTQNFYGSGCECIVSYLEQGVKTSYSYGTWTEKENSYRFDEPYKETDTVSPLEKTVYLTPTKFSEADTWTYDELTSTNTERVITRTVYVSPLKLGKKSSPADKKPEEKEDRIIKEVDYCRIIRNGEAEEWEKCN